MKRLIARVTIGLSALILIVVAYAALTLARARGGLPQWDAEMALADLGDDATVRRDATGTPFIEASNERDLYFVQGFVHAQDRFWQMAIGRQATLGRLSEWLGPLTVATDRLSRMWGWAEQAERAFAALPSEDRALLEAYSAGVNAWLDSPAYRRPPEMVVLHVDPEPWRPEDSFLVVYAMHRTLTAGGTEFDRATLAASGADPSAIEILSDPSVLAPPIIAATPGEAIQQTTAAYKSQAFSDNWTVSGEHTVSGKPLMANDPQLPVTLPGTWHLQHQTLDGRRLAGGTLPGVPGIIVGHNGAVSWGITNAQTDMLDVAFLEIHPEDSSRYRRGPDEEWLAFDEVTEVIRVRFGRDRVETRRRTPFGVVWPEGLPSRLVGDVPDRTLELRDVALDLENAAAVSFIHMNRAASVDQGLAAAEGVTAPSVNLSIADTTGTIGYVMTGRIPQRVEAHATRVGFAPDDGNDWTYLGFDANPRVVSPADGRIVTANQQIIGSSFPHYLTDMWAAPHRAWRIHELLDAQTLHDPGSFVSMQSDAMSPIARTLVPLMLPVDPIDEADRVVVDLLAAWDYRFALDSPAPTVWLTWVDLLRHAVLADETRADRLDWAAVVMYDPLAKALSGERADWCDHVETEAVESCDGFLAQTLSDARRALEGALGPDPQAWTWGETARFNIGHVGFDGLPLLGSRFSRETPIPGGPESLFTNAVMYAGAPRFSSSLFNSGYQAVYDLADLDASVFMVPGGPSGHFGSPFYDNRTAAWVAGERFVLSPDELEPIATMRLIAR